MIRPKILVTHNDLDGVGCAVLYLKAFPNTHVYFTDYKEVNNLLAEILGDCHWASEIVITDMSPSADMAEILHRRGNVSLIDHHPTATYLMETYPWAVVDTEHSATKLVHAMLSNTHLMQDYDSFTQLVDNYDTWGHGQGPTDKAKQLNSLLWVLGQERFLKRFVTVSSCDLSPTEVMLLELEAERQAKYLSMALPEVNVLSDAQGYKYGLVAAEQYTSALGNAILSEVPELEYVIILNMLTNTASLRGHGNLHLGEMAKALGGGGHKRAAGFPLNDATQRMWR